MDSTFLPPLSPAIQEENRFLISGKSEYSYGDLFQFGTYFKNSMQSHGIDKSQPLGLHTRSSDTLTFIIASCWLHNIPFIPLHSPKALQAFTENSGEGLQPRLVISSAPTFSSSAVKSISIDEFNHEKILSKGAITFRSQRSNPQGIDNIFGYFFTSGTSGRPKIVPLRRRQILAGAAASAQNLQPDSNEAWLLCLPLNHIGGISVILRSLIYGSAIYRLDEFNQSQVASLLSTDKRVVAASLVPTMLKRLLNNDGFCAHKTFKAVLLGGGPISSALLQKGITRNIPIIPSYGMTETCAQIAANPLFSHPEDEKLLLSVGTIFSPNIIQIRDKKRVNLPIGKSGTIWLKGAQVFDGYGGLSARKNFDADGWFNTGDLGYLDNKNRLYIETRRTDLIITGGENVSPDEVEAALEKMEFIKEAAVFGVPDPEWGQKVIAVIVFSGKEKKSAKEIQAILRKSLEAYKTPKEFIAVESLPRTATGKIKRTKLIDQYQSK